MNWSARENEYYGIYYGVRLIEDLSYFLLKTDQINLTYINVTFTDKVLRWKLTHKDFDLYQVPGKKEHQFLPDTLLRLCVNNVSPPPTSSDKIIVTLVSMLVLPLEVTGRLKKVHNSQVGHWGLDICRRRLDEGQPKQGSAVSPIE